MTLHNGIITDAIDDTALQSLIANLRSVSREIARSSPDRGGRAIATDWIQHHPFAAIGAALGFGYLATRLMRR